VKRRRAIGTDVPPPYENAVVFEFGLRGIASEQQARFNVVYKRVKITLSFVQVNSK